MELLTLPCSASGYPDPIVTVTKGDGSFRSSSVLSVEYRETVMETSQRNYVCSASNKHGTVNWNCTIEVVIRSKSQTL